MKINWVFVGAMGATILIIAIGVILAPKTSPSRSRLDISEKAKLELSETFHDWGDIDMKNGKVNHIFKVKNVGEEGLKLANFKTSCMCTEVKLILRQAQDEKVEESPTFGMHTQSDWVGVILPGGEGEVEVIFDPAYHGPQGTGSVTRTVNFETNDKDNAMVELRLEAYVR